FRELRRERAERSGRAAHEVAASGVAGDHEPADLEVLHDRDAADLGVGREEGVRVPLRQGFQDLLEIALRAAALSEITDLERALPPMGLVSEPRKDEDDVPAAREHALAQVGLVSLRRLEAVPGARDVPAVEPENDVAGAAELVGLRDVHARVPHAAVLSVE